MAKIAKNLTELIGRTPLMELAEYSRKYGLKQNIIAKLEAFNPAGSVKDRVALAMIEDAEARGALKQRWCDRSGYSYHRAYQWKYRCGTGDGCYNQRISPDAHDARNHEYRAS